MLASSEINHTAVVLINILNGTDYYVIYSSSTFHAGDILD